MKANRVRVGEKFVLEDKGGLWQKLGTDEQGVMKARCIFGNKEDFGSEVIVDPLAFVYVIFERTDNAPSQSQGGLKIMVGDEDSEDTLLEIKDASSAQVAAFASVEAIMLKAPRGHKEREYTVSQTMLNPEQNTFYVVVRQTYPFHNKEEDHDDAVQSTAGAKTPVEARSDGVPADGA